jgi:hypothetical protein
MPAYTNLALQSANLADVGSPWAGNGSFAIEAATSVIPGQTAWKHTSTSGFRNQEIGVFTGAPETVVFLVENVDAETSRVGLFTGSVFEVFVRLTWATMAVADPVAGSDVGVVDLGTGPNGGALALIFATNSGTVSVARHLYCYPRGTESGTLSAIPHYAALFEAATYPPAYLVNGSTVTEKRVIDLSAYKLSARPTERRVPLTHLRRRASGKMSSAIHSDATVRREWSFTTEIEDRDTGEALQAELETAGPALYVHNPLIYAVTGVGVECAAENVRRLDGPLEDHVRLAWDLIETRPY